MSLFSPEEISPSLGDRQRLQQVGRKRQVAMNSFPRSSQGRVPPVRGKAILISLCCRRNCSQGHSEPFGVPATNLPDQFAANHWYYWHKNGSETDPLAV